MLDQYFGTKELYEVVLRAKNPMYFGSRYIEAEEPVLYFEHIDMATLQERNTTVSARGGWGNMPHVIWEDRSEVRFTLSKGVMSSIGFGVLLSARVAEGGKSEPIYVSKREGPFTPEIKDMNGNDCLPRIYLEHWPVAHNIKKTFIFIYESSVEQQKIYGKRITGVVDEFGEELPTIELYKDKELQTPADIDKEYVIDYYYQYEQEALIYSIQKERFNGLFTLEGKFYSKDENDGINYTNYIRMPKVRVVSDINLRLGERADPTTSVFTIIGVPETTAGHKDGLVLEIWRLEEDIDAND